MSQQYSDVSLEQTQPQEELECLQGFVQSKQEPMPHGQQSHAHEAVGESVHEACSAMIGAEKYIQGGNTQWTMTDAVYGHVKLRRELKAFIDNPIFNRLHDLRQLGCAYRVYPGAHHTRFEHSLGVASLAGEMYRQLVGLKYNPHHELLVMLAGLCHDLGHAPFSHTFESEIMPRLDPHSNWHHEDMSEILLDEIVSDLGGEAPLRRLGLSMGDIRLVKAMICGDVTSLPPEYQKHKYLFRIVNNKNCGVDVDKMDYLLRDALHTGAKTRFADKYIISRARIREEDGELAWDHGLYYMLMDLFSDRAHMHQRVYKHKKVKAMEMMLGDALKLAEPELQLLKKAHDPQAFVRLKDSITEKVMDLEPDETADPDGVRAAQALLRRINCRQLYRCVLEKPLADHEKLPTPQEILAFYDSGELHQQPQQQRKQDTEHQTPQVYGECSEGQGGFTSMAQQQAAAGRSGAGAACSAGATGTRSHVSCHGAVDGSALGGAARKVQKQQLQAQEQGRQQKQAPLLPEHLRVSDHKVDFGSKGRNPLEHAVFVGGEPDRGCLGTPHRFQRRYLRVYCTQPITSEHCADVDAKLRAAVEAWYAYRAGGSAAAGGPAGRRQLEGAAGALQTATAAVPHPAQQEVATDGVIAGTGAGYAPAAGHAPVPPLHTKAGWGWREQAATVSAPATPVPVASTTTAASTGEFTVITPVAMRGQGVKRPAESQDPAC